MASFTRSILVLALAGGTSPMGYALAAQPSGGQEASTPSADARAGQQDTGAGDIVVTAQKRGERLIDVPISISAESAETMKAAGINNVRELSQLVPGLSIVNFGVQLTPAIRGITSQSVTSGDEANVAIYLDDVYLANSFANIMDLKDIERVEVLKGPQGTLAGRNAGGGAIKVFTRDPTATPAVELDTRYGFDLNEKQVSGLVSGGLSDDLAASVTGYYNKRGGYVRNLNTAAGQGKIGQIESYIVRGKVLWRPDPDLRIVLSADLGSRDSEADFLLTTLNGNSSFANRPGVIISTGAGTVSASNFLGGVLAKNRGVALNATWNIGSTTLKSITSYRTVRGDYSTDSDRTNLPIGSDNIAFKSSSFSQEINLGGESKDFSWVVGAYYLDYPSTLVRRSWASDPEVTAPNGGFTAKQSLASYSAFADGTYSITDRLSLSAGLRYTRDKRSASYLGFTGLSDKGSRSYSQATYRGVVKYDIDDRSNVYASYSTGYKSGLFSANAFPLIAVKPEKISAIEVGYKAQFTSGLFVTLAAYDYKYDDIQLLVPIGVPGSTTGATVTLLQNAARGRTRGVDLDAQWQIGGLMLRGGVAWLPTAKYKSFPGAFVYSPLANGQGNVGALTDASGARMLKASKLQLNLGASYSHELPSGRLNASINYSYKSAFPWVTGGRLSQDGFSVANARLGWEINDHVEVGVFAENFTNSSYQTWSIEAPSGDTAVYAPPRQFGVSLGLKY